jgi:parvulin-like peptidyl-prolyl isomerase
LGIGELSDPIKTPSGYYLINVVDRDPARDVDETEFETRRAQAFEEWLAAQKEAANIEDNWSVDHVPPLPDDLQTLLISLSRNLQQ